LGKGYRITVVTPTDDFSARMAGMGCDLHELPMDNKGSNPLNDLRTLKAYTRFYRESRPDVALHHTIKPVIYGSMAARRLGIPVINTITGLGTAFMTEGWLTRVVEVLYRVSQRGSRRVYFQNHDDYDLFQQRRLVAADIAECLPGSGVDLERFSVQPYPERQSMCFLLVARLLWDKGVGEFVEAARKFKADYPDSRFQLLGSMDVANRSAISGDSVRRWVEQGIVEYLGETEDVRPHIAAAGCVVLPSYREGTPRCLLEAGAMARPVITTDVPGCREVVDDGTTGFLCASQSPDDLAGKMRKLREMKFETRRNMGLLARDKVEREFDERWVISRYAGTIEGILAPGRA